ncbi:MAG: cohesin domain-containing protein [Candidatus Bathyarchaeia archaeon]
MNPKRNVKIALFTVLLFSLASTCFVYAASAETMSVKAEASSSEPKVGDTLTVNVKISNAQDIFGLDVTVDWNPDVLQFISATPQLGVESHPGGVLHESTDYPIDTQDNSNTAGEYHLLATAQGASTAGFTGSGTIVTLTFNVTSTGSTGLSLDVELAQLGNTEIIVPSTSVDTVNATIPEFPTTLLIVAILVAAAATIIASTKLLKNKTITATAHI